MTTAQHSQNYVYTYNRDQKYSVTFDQYGNWTFWKDGEVPSDGKWTLWSSGLTWEAASDACCKFRN